MIRTLARTILPVLFSFMLVGAVSADPGALRLVSANDSGLEIDLSLSGLDTQIVDAPAGPYTMIEVPGFGFGEAVGSPRLPVLRSLLEVPPGATCSALVEAPVFAETALEAPVLPLQPPRPKTSDPAPAFVRDAAAYSRAGYADPLLVSIEEAGTLRGHHLVQIVVRPVDYNPATNRLRVLESGRIRIEWSGGDAGTAELRRARYSSPAFDRVLQGALLNPAPLRYNPGGEIGCLVISAPAFFADANLANLLAWKTQRGLHVTHVSTDQTGTTKELIKAYLQNAYDTWSIPPTFVLLVGDTDRIPYWVGIGADSPATDLNYSMLEGSDYLPDIEIGRLSVADATDLANIVAKILSFEQVGWTGNNDWEKHATFMASEDNYTVSEGTHNYVIAQYLTPLGYTSDKLYCHTYSATTAQVRTAFNVGRSQGTYSGHGAETYWADGPVFYQSDVNALTNTVYPFVQSYSCLTGSFSTSECFGETWLRAAHGAVTFFGSSVTSYWTEDDILQKRVYEGFYNDQNPGEVDQTWIGGMIVYGKLKFYDYFGATSTTRRYFEMYNILGDPTVDIWTAIPAASQVDAPATLLTGQTSFAVTVTGTPNAMISARKQTGGNNIFVTAWTDAGGHATVNLGEALTPGTLNLAVTVHDRIPYLSSIQVIQSAGPYLTYEGVAVHDESGDGLADAGETVGLEVTLENIGVVGATGITGALSSSDGFAQILTPLRSFSNIPAGGFGCCTQPFQVLISGNTPDQHVIQFDLAAHATEGQWPCGFSLTVQAPVLAAAGTSIDDSPPLGNGNGAADPGESFYLMLWIANTGHGAARNLAGILSSTHPSVHILDADGECVVAAPGGSGLLTAFQMELLPGCPNPATLPLQVALSGPGYMQTSLSYELSVGSWADDAEVDRRWTLGAAEDNATTGLWVRAEPVGTIYNSQQVQTETDHTTDPGSLCFVTGNGAVGGAAADSDVDGGKTTLLSPVFSLNGALSATVDYWRWYTNNLGNNPNQDYWDVDVTGDGTNWVHLEHTTASANSWTHYTFQLEQFVTLTNQVRLRFVATDDSPGSMVDAAVDDLTLTVVRSPATDVPGTDPGGRTGLISCRPNPLGPQGSIVYRLGQQGRARLALYDIAGREVRVLVDQVLPAGEHSVRLGQGSSGPALSSGIYFLRMETADILQIRQVAVIR